LALGQAVDPVVEEQDFDIEVPANGMEKMIAADAQPVAVTGDDPDGQIGTGDLDPGGKGRRTPVNAVETVGVQVVGKPAGTADPGDKHELLPGDAQGGQDLLDLGENAVIAASRAPANVLVALEILRRQNRQRCFCAHSVIPPRSLARLQTLFPRRQMACRTSC
jgi:hypothetical protein